MNSHPIPISLKKMKMHASGIEIGEWQMFTCMLCRITDSNEYQEYLDLLWHHLGLRYP